MDGSESSHVSGHKPTLGEVARKMREMMMGKADTPPQTAGMFTQESLKLITDRKSTQESPNPITDRKSTQESSKPITDRKSTQESSKPITERKSTQESLKLPTAGMSTQESAKPIRYHHKTDIDRPPSGLGTLYCHAPGFTPTSSPQDLFQASTPSTQNPTGTGLKPAQAGAPISAARAGKKSSYDKLIAMLQTNHPNLSSADAQSYIMELRKSNNGKLSGMSIQDIMKKVGTFIERDQGISGGACAEDKSCSICFEDMCATDSRYLHPCRHRFHYDCINKWLESPGGAGSTCPMCRNYIVNEEEFPKLGSSRKF